MDLALLVTIACVVAGAASGGVLRTWSMHRRMYSLEDRMIVLEGVTQREVKIRAAGERWKKPATDDAALVALMTPKEPQKPKGPWWMNPDLKRGAYP